ncbi:hypothetical protein GQ53DRAFT_822338 [Thozetella sp. PMI_491]|nr:hypothetical protein GQ53DRAFT_822338 [Thozetella sp. PMI_491]
MYSSTVLVPALIGVVSAISITPPLTKPSGSRVVPRNFVSFNIEAAFLHDYYNDFSNNLVRAVANRMSLPPIIRVGGTSGDEFLIDDSQSEVKVCVSGTCGSSSASYKLGPSYFEAFKGLTSATMSFQAPMGNPINIDRSLAYVTRAWNALGNDRLAAIALGNEPNFYDTQAQYIQDALTIQGRVISALGLTGTDATRFVAGEVDSGHVNTGTSYQVSDILAAGINNNGHIRSTAEHYYQVMDTSTVWSDDVLQKLVLNHTAIANRLGKYQKNIDASRNAKLPFVISEGAACLSAAGNAKVFCGGFAFTLWAVDSNLAAMTAGVSRIANMVGRPAAARTFWVPNDSATDNPGPQVRAPFPATMFLNDFVGKDNLSAIVSVETNRQLLSAYGMYNDATQKLERMALLNLHVYNGTKGNTRGVIEFEVAVGNVASVRVQRLHANLGIAAMGFDYGGPAHNVSWAGEQWSYSVDKGNGHFTSGKVQEQVVAVSGGTAVISIPDSEAVIVYL